MGDGFLDSHVHKSDTGLLDFQVQTDKILPVPTRKGEATKARILEAAADLLISGNDINLDEVMDLTHTSKGQIFHYFPGGKEELRRTAAERHLARLAQADAPAALATWQDWESWIEQILRLHKKQGRTDACEVAALAGRALDTDGVTRDLVGRMYEQWALELGTQLTAMQASGLLREDAPVSELASTMLAALQGGAIIDKATGSNQHLARSLHQTLVLLRTYAA